MARNKVWNTGVDDTGARVALGHRDPHWMVVQGPGILNPQRAVVLQDQRAGTYFPPMDSMWVWANGTGDADPSAPFIFEMDFYLELDLAQNWFEIKGAWCADNFGHFAIDNAPLPAGSGSGTSLPAGNVSANYKQPHDFSIKQAHLLSTSHLVLKVGWHKLQVLISNEGPESNDNPAGFNISAIQFVAHAEPVIHPVLP